MNTSKYNFTYRDTVAYQRDLQWYEVGAINYEEAGFCATFLRGGLLTGCNLRFIITQEIGNVLEWAETDYANRGTYIFSFSSHYTVLDIYKIGDYCQILLSRGLLDKDMKQEVTGVARKDFNELLHKQPVSIIDTPEWRMKVRPLIAKSSHAMF